MPPLVPALLPAGFYLLSAVLVYGVARALELSRWAAFWSGIVYLTSFVHFQALLGSQAGRDLQAASLFLALVLIGLKPVPERPLFWASVLFSVAAVIHGGLAAFSPFVTAVASFLQPVQSALTMDPAQAGYPIPPQVAVWSILFSVLFAVSFWHAVKIWNRKWAVLLAWYLFCVVYFLEHAFQLRQVLPSRAFLFLSPIFSVVFAGGLITLLERVQKNSGMSRRAGRAITAVIFTVLCLANLAAVPVVLFRGKLANSILMYRDLRPAADDFDRLLGQGISGFRLGREREARDLLEQAVRERPFLLRHLLGRCRLEDSRWVTGPLGLRGFLRRIQAEQATPKPVFEVLQKEIADYAVGLLCISYLEMKGSRVDSGRTWLSQLRYLERDPERLADWVGSLPFVRGDPALAEFSGRLRDPSFLEDPIPWRKDDYGFGRFVVRLMTGWNIQSAWDKQAGVKL